MKKAIAMKCSQEQFEAIKPKLKGMEIGSISNFNEWNYLVNNADGLPSVVCNTGKSGSIRHNREIHETWNERIFLEACGIEVEEIYQIIKDQILKSENGFTTDNLYKWFPEAFEVKLEVGKWYRRATKYCNWLMNYQLDKSKCYGFNTCEKWGNNYIIEDTVDWTEATQQEVFEALKNEAEKRYKIGDYINGLYMNKVSSLSFERTGNGQGSVHVDIYDSVWMAVGEHRNEKVFENGIWATVIPTKTKEEAEKLLNCKIV